MPSSANAALYGYQVAPGASWTFPSQNTMVRIAINDNLKVYFGFSSQTTFGIITPAQNMNYLSDVCPSISRVFSIYLGCNLIVSEYNQIGNLFAQFPISSSYGNLIKVESQEALISIKEGIYNDITVSLWDQENKPLQFIDKDLTLFLIVETND
jgi:hypothetical protein